MRRKNELIRTLIDVVKANCGREDCLYLPDWSDADWQCLLDGAEVMMLGDGDLLLQRDDPSNDLYFLVDGKLAVSVPQSDGMTMTAPVTRSPGSIVGEIAFLDRGARTASVWSRGQSVLLRLPATAVLDIEATEPRLACDLLYAIGRIVAERLRRCIGAPTKGRPDSIRRHLDP